MTSQDRVNECIVGYRRRKRIWFLGIGTAMAAVSALLALSAAALLDMITGLSVSMRTIALFAIGLCVVFIMVVRSAIPVFRFGIREAISDIERGLKSLGQRLRTAYQISHESPLADTGFSPVLADAVIRQTGEALETTDLRAMIPWLHARRWLRTAGCCLMLFLVVCLFSESFQTGILRLIMPRAGITYTRIHAESDRATFSEGMTVTIQADVSGRPIQTAQLLTRTKNMPWNALESVATNKTQPFTWTLKPKPETLEFMVTGGDAQTKPMTVSYVEAVKVISVHARVVYPDYTRVGAIETESGNIRALIGSQATVKFKLNQPLSMADVRSGQGTNFPVKIEGSEVTVDIPITKDIKTYALICANKHELKMEPVTYHITALQDQVPEVVFVEPKRDLSVTKVWEMPLRVKAKDDYGLHDLDIILKVGDKEDTLLHRDFSKEGDIALDVKDMAQMALEKYPLTINDNLRLYARAHDWRPNSEQEGVSDIIWIDIRPFKQPYASREGGGGGNMTAEALLNLEDIIRKQRDVISKTLRHLARKSEDAEAGSALSKQELALSEDTSKLKSKLQMLSEDDLKLVDIAAAQMLDAGNQLEKREWPMAYQNEEDSLTNLLQVRKLVLIVLVKQSKGQGQSQKSEDSPIVPLSQLAKEADRLSSEETSVEQGVKEAKDSAVPKSLVGKQDTAVADGGELHDSLISHPDATTLALNRMRRAEDMMYEAYAQMVKNMHDPATDHLRTSAEELHELAEHLRGLDQAQQAETLKKIQERAESTKSEIEKAGRSSKESSKPESPDGQDSGKSAGNENQPSDQGSGKSSGSGKQPGDQGSGKSDGSGKQPGDQGSGEQGGDKQVSTESSAQEGGQSNRQTEAQTGEDRARTMSSRAATVHDWLTHMQEKEGNEEQMTRIDKLIKDVRTGELPDDILREQALRHRGQLDQAGKLNDDLAKRLGELAEAANREYRNTVQSELERLARLEADTRSLLEQAKPDAKNGKAGGKGGGGDQVGPGRDGKESHPLGFTQGVQDLAEELGMSEDQGLRDFSEQLAKSKVNDQPELLEKIDHRLEDLIREIVRREYVANKETAVPAKYLKMVEEYTKKLSNDMDDKDESGGEE